MESADYTSKGPLPGGSVPSQMPFDGISTPVLSSSSSLSTILDLPVSEEVAGEAEPPNKSEPNSAPSSPTSPDDGEGKSKGKKTLWLLLGSVLLILVALAIGLFIAKKNSSSGGKAGKDSSTTATPSITVDIPEGESREIEESKTKSYMGRGGIDRYFGSLEGNDPSPSDEGISLLSSPSPRSVSSSEEVPPSKTAKSPAETLFPPDSPSPSSSGTSSTSSSSRGAGASRGRGTSGGTSPSFSSPKASSSSALSEEEQQRRKLEYDRRRAEMVRDILIGTPGEGPATVGESASSSPSEESSQERTLDFREDPDGIIMSLDDDLDPSGTSSAIQYSEGSMRPFRCMFVREEKIKDGQRVTLRLLEDYTDGNVRIPENTHLSAVCKISGRLHLSVRSIEISGRILPLSLEAYDIDGMKGIYCPETTRASAARDLSREAIGTGNTILGGLVGEIAGTVIRTGATIAKSAAGEVSISVVSGYEFFLVKTK